jgi:hypothetical protein
MLVLAISLIAAAVLGLTWYCFFLRHMRRKAREVQRWIQSALAGRGQVTGISWTGASQFRVPLRLSCGIFQRAWVLVELHSLQAPVQWLAHKLKGRLEMLTFQADLDFPPTFSLHVHNFRWVARHGRKAPANKPGWRFECLQPLIISTRTDHHKEIAQAMASLTRADGSDLVDISFQKSSPHFSATLVLNSLAPGSPARLYLLDTMRELAGSASASLF